MFELYKEPEIFSKLIFYFSTILTFLMWFIVLFLLKIVISYKKNEKISSIYPIMIAILITQLNWYGLVMNLYFIIPVYVLVAYLSLKYIDEKGVKWTNACMSIFILFIILSYTYFNNSIHKITYAYFNATDILQYHFEFKDYFKIYHIGDFLGSVEFEIEGQIIKYENEPLEFRLYAFYYIMNTISLAVWFLIYLNIVKKHKYRFKKLF